MSDALPIIAIVLAILMCVGEPDLLDAVIARVGGVPMSCVVSP